MQEAGYHPDLLKIAADYLLSAKRMGKQGASAYETVSVDVRVDGNVQWLFGQLWQRLDEAEQGVLADLLNGRPAQDLVLLTQLQRRGMVAGKRPFADAFRYWLQREIGSKQPNPVSTVFFRHEPDNRLLYADERTIRLTKLENRILSYFVEHANEVCTVEALLEDIWGVGKTRSVVEKGVSRLREKVEIDPKRPRYLLSAWGEGYTLRI